MSFKTGCGPLNYQHKIKVDIESIQSLLADSLAVELFMNQSPFSGTLFTRTHCFEALEFDNATKSNPF